MALDLLINIPVGIIGAIATLLLMPNYTMQTRRFDLSGFLLLAVGMAVLTTALDGSKGTGLSPLTIAGWSQLAWWHWCFICCTPEITTVPCSV